MSMEMNKANECTCPSGDGSLVHPCPAHPSVEQAGGDERAAFEAWSGDRFMQDTIHNRTVFGAGYRAALAQPSPVHAEQEEVERPELWAVHAQGPDELYAAFTREDAEKHAAELNALPMPEGIAVGAVVVPSPWPAVQHWQYLAEQEQDHKNEITGRLRQLERICEGLPQDAIDGGWTVQGIRGYAKRLEDQLKAALARAQHSVPEGWMLVECGIWTQEQVDEMQKTVTRFRNSEFVDDRALAMAVADAGQCKAPEISLAELLAAAPGNSAQHSVPEGWKLVPLEPLLNMMSDKDHDTRITAERQLLSILADAPGNLAPQAWLDVQAERRRQITAEGWTPQHDDEHADGQMAQAAGCYALHAGGIGTGWPDGRQNGSALFWPWDKDSWKPSTARRDMVKACALALAEIERLDRAEPGKEGV
ncbi:hypothetical protein [Pseudomonas aeruginosa]|uniref:hypothetical protein n=1 Tax=Pseudomonas aeruginosa TaxID=287 RepID=UPI003525BA72